MRLLALEAAFVRLHSGEGAGKRTFSVTGSPHRLHGSDGLVFYCPKCWARNVREHGLGSWNGTHRILCWWDHVGPDVPGGLARWIATGATLEDLTLVSTKRTVPEACGWNVAVTLGDASA